MLFFQGPIFLALRIGTVVAHHKRLATTRKCMWRYVLRYHLVIVTQEGDFAMGAPSFDFQSRWSRAASAMKAHGIDALFVMRPADLACLIGDGPPCALGLITRALQCVVAVPASDVHSVRTSCPQGKA
jgi:hypothetical protein